MREIKERKQGAGKEGTEANIKKINLDDSGNNHGNPASVFFTSLYFSNNQGCRFLKYSFKLSAVILYK